MERMRIREVGRTPVETPERETSERLGLLPLGVHAERQFFVQCGVAGVLVVLSLVGEFVRFGLHHDHVFGLLRLFNLDVEHNVPTWFQTVTLAWCCVVIGWAGRVHASRTGGWDRRWGLLAIGFALMSADEAAGIHENAQLPAGLLESIPAYQAFSWVVVGVVVVLLVVRYFWRWAMSLPSPTRRYVGLAGTLYVLGAVGCEAVGGIEAITIGLDNPIYSLTYTVEESLEMAGVALMTYAMLDLIRTESEGAIVRVEPPGSRT